MLSRRFVPAIAAAVAVLIAVPVAAGAAPTATAARFGGGCRIDINVEPHEMTAGDPVTIFGRLVCRHRSAAGRVVKLFHHLDGGRFGFSYVQSTITDAQGAYVFNRADGAVETNRAWYVRAGGTRSAAKRIRVAAEIALSGPAEGSQLLTGKANSVTFTGTESPADAGARVILQRQNALNGSEWRRIDSGRVQPGGVFSIVHTFLVPGDANVRVLVRSQGRNIPSSSNILEYEISQAQNPALTIAASSDPIAFGQSVTITGVLAGGLADRPVTLLARTRGQAWAPVAATTTNTTGDYTLQAQSPTNSTFYRVQSATTTVLTCVRAPCVPPAAMIVESAVLFEGVRDVLSAGVSATTVQAGTQLTFSGAVAPAHAGHVVYLERENAAGGAFHVVQVGIVNSASGYSIVHRVYDPGTKVFRVYIPGGPENQGAASQPFTIQVTPAPASGLTPEAPGGSPFPSEGSEAPGENKEEAEKP